MCEARFLLVGGLNDLCACRWCSEPAATSRAQDLSIRLREHLKGLSAWVSAQVQMMAPVTDASTGEVLEEGMASEASRQAVVW